MAVRVLATTAAVLLGTALSGPAAASAAGATPKATPVRCGKGKAAKRVRVTVRVRRRYRGHDGRMRIRTVRRRVWRTRCVTATAPTPKSPATPAPVATPPATGPGTPAPGPASPSGPDCSGANVSVSLREFSVSPTRDCVAAGTVNVDVLNFGEDPHSLALRPAAGGPPSWILPGPNASSELAPGGHLHEAVAIPAGRWTLYCSLPGHEALGMTAELEAR